MASKSAGLLNDELTSFSGLLDIWPTDGLDGLCAGSMDGLLVDQIVGELAGPVFLRPSSYSFLALHLNGQPADYMQASWLAG